MKESVFYECYRKIITKENGERERRTNKMKQCMILRFDINQVPLLGCKNVEMNKFKPNITEKASVDSDFSF